MRKIFIVALAALILVFTMTACGNPSDSFETQIEQGNYGKAIEIYTAKLSGNSEYENSARSFLQGYFEESWNNYKSGEIADQEFMNRYTTIEKVNEAVWALYDMDTVYHQYLSVKDSKDAYAKGTVYVAQGEFESAINVFSQVISDDTENYDNAQNALSEAIEQYQDEIIDSATQLAAAGNFDEAVFCIREAENIVDNTEKLEGCLSDLYTQKYTDSITAALEAGDHITVIKEYVEASANEYVAISSDLTNKYSSSFMKYLEVIDQKTAAAFGGDKDYSSAISILQSAIAEVGVDASIVEALDERIAEYQAYIPVSLTSLDYTQKAKYINVGLASTSDATDVNGNKYDADTVLYPKGYFSHSDFATSDDEAYVLYNLNLNYSTMSGTIYRPYSSLSATPEEWGSTVSVKIYGDDVLLYEAPEITQNTYDSYPFTLDVTGVRNLKIVMRGIWSKKVGFAEYTRKPTVCMAEVMLQK